MAHYYANILIDLRIFLKSKFKKRRGNGHEYNTTERERK